ncbi:MAG: hypothetical protein K2Q12_07900 [Rickettsiales bacterium]|nr:hypothetical protein [Rickettsiales bacterium]
MNNTIGIDSLVSELGLPIHLTEKLAKHGLISVAALVDYDRSALQKTIFKSRAPLEPLIGVLEAHLYEHGLVLGQPLAKQLQSRKEIPENTAFLQRVISSVFTKGISAALKRKGVLEVADLKSKTYTELLVIKGLGPVNVAHIAQTLALNGIRLRSIYLAPLHPEAQVQTPAAKPVRKNPNVIEKLPIEEPMLIGDTLQSTGALFIASDAAQAMAFKKFVLEKLQSTGLPEDFSKGEDDLRFAVKLVGDYEGKPAVYVQQNLLNQLWDDQYSLVAAFKINQDHIAASPKVTKR